MSDFFLRWVAKMDWDYLAAVFLFAAFTGTIICFIWDLFKQGKQYLSAEWEYHLADWECPECKDRFTSEFVDNQKHDYCPYGGGRLEKRK